MKTNKLPILVETTGPVQITKSPESVVKHRKGKRQTEVLHILQGLGGSDGWDEIWTHYDTRAGRQSVDYQNFIFVCDALVRKGLVVCTGKSRIDLSAAGMRVLKQNHLCERKFHPRSARFAGLPVTVRLANALDYLGVTTLDDLTRVIQDRTLILTNKVGSKTMLEALSLIGHPKPPTIECHQCGHKHVCVSRESKREAVKLLDTP